MESLTNNKGAKMNQLALEGAIIKDIDVFEDVTAAIGTMCSGMEYAATDIELVAKGYAAQSHRIENSTITVILKLGTGFARVFVDVLSSGDGIPMSLDEFMGTIKAAKDMCNYVDMSDPTQSAAEA